MTSGGQAPDPAAFAVEAMVLAAEFLSDDAVERLAIAYSRELARRRPGPCRHGEVG